MPCFQKGVFAFVININVLLQYRYQYFDKVRKILTGNITNAPLRDRGGKNKSRSLDSFSKNLLITSKLFL